MNTCSSSDYRYVGLDTPSFSLLASIRASGILSIGVANGYVFAGNAALLGTCDLIVATRGGNKSRGGKAGKTSIGMGGPAMIAGGGLGEYAVSEYRSGLLFWVREVAYSSSSVKFSSFSSSSLTLLCLPLRSPRPFFLA